MWHPADRLFATAQGDSDYVGNSVGGDATEGTTKPLVSDTPEEQFAGDGGPPPCPYCGHAEFAELPSNGRADRAQCAQCGGVVYSTNGNQWQPELIGDPSNHPSDQPDPASGGVGGAASSTVMMDRQMRTKDNAEYTASLHFAVDFGSENNDPTLPTLMAGQDISLESVPLDRILGGTKLNEAKVRRYQKMGTPFPPGVGVERRGQIMLFEGNHRAEAARRLGETHIDAYIGRDHHTAALDPAFSVWHLAGEWAHPGLPAEQQAARDAPDATYKQRFLDLAKSPVSTTQIWRAEVRHKDDLHRPPSVGMHWTVNPDQVVSPHEVPANHHRVMWQATVDDPERQVIPRSHPIWSGTHRSMDSEAEVRLQPGTQVHVNRRYVHDNNPDNSAMPYPFAPERSSEGWTAHEMDEHVPVAHQRPDDGMMRYKEKFPDLFSEHTAAGAADESSPRLSEDSEPITDEEHAKLTAILGRHTRAHPLPAHRRWSNIPEDGMPTFGVHDLSQVKHPTGLTTTMYYDPDRHHFAIDKGFLRSPHADMRGLWKERGARTPGGESSQLEQGLTHEYGHSLHSQMGHDENNAMLHDVSRAIPGATPFNAQHETPDDWVERNRPAITQHVSEHGAHSQFEMAADLYAEHDLADEPSEAARIALHHLHGSGSVEHTASRHSHLTFWHGSPSGDLRGGAYGLHIGTQESARQALHARIGRPAEGEWDGTREYGKTLLAGSNTLQERGDYPSGYNVGTGEDHYPTGKATYGDETPIPLHAKPDVFPVRITGEMSNTPDNPHEDFKANGYMKAQLSRGRAKRGYFYTNVSEDEGSVSAVVPNGNHLERLPREQHQASFDAWMWREAMPGKRPAPEDLTFDRYDPAPSDPYHHGELEKLKPGWSHHLMRSWLPSSSTDWADKRMVGSIMYSKSPEGHQPPTVAVHRMYVGEDERGRGVASAMQDELHHQHPTHLVDHGDRSDDGVGWWKQYQTPAGHPNAELSEGDRLLGRTDPDPALNHVWRERQAALNDEVPWCAHLYHGHCNYPGDKLPGGQILGIPQDRGPCPWKSSAFQQAACPISDPGPMAIMTVTAGENGELPENFRVEYADHGGRHHLRALDGDTPIGGLSWLKHGNPNLGIEPGEVHNIWTDEEYKRRGVATALWNAAHSSDLDPKPVHTPDEQSESGEAWARHVGVTAAHSTDFEMGDYGMPTLSHEDNYDALHSKLTEHYKILDRVAAAGRHAHPQDVDAGDAIDRHHSAYSVPNIEDFTYGKARPHHHAAVAAQMMVNHRADALRRPQPTVAFDRIPDEDHPHSAAMADYNARDQHIRIDPKMIQKEVRRPSSEGWFSKTGNASPMQRTLSHEEGHHRELHMDVRQRGKMFRDIADTIPDATPFTHKFGMEDKLRDWHNENYAHIINHVGVYAATNHHELAAELYAEHRHAHNPSPAAQAAGRHMEGRDDDGSDEYEGFAGHLGQFAYQGTDAGSGCGNREGLAAVGGSAVLGGLSEEDFRVASLDKEASWHLTATWQDVRDKAKAIRADGGVRIAVASPDSIGGEVRGDHNVYETILTTIPGSYKVATWQCGCKWAAYAWGRSPAYKRFEGRMCSHALAMQYEAQSRGMFGKNVTEDRERPQWLKPHTPVVVQYERPSEKRPKGIDLTRRAVPPGNMRRTFGSKEAAMHANPVFAIEALKGLGMSHVDAQRVVREVTVSKQAGRRCPECGAELSSNAHICPQCGAHLDDLPEMHMATAEDARAHAHDFGEGVPEWNAGPLKTCGQCRGNGCGHCGGTGQVIDGGDGTEMNAMPDQNDDAGQVMQDTGLSYSDGNSIALGAAKEHTGPSVAGVALKAADTGRVLMLQRGYEDEDDPARGTWEFPGGHIEPGDATSLHGGIREWEEEVGQPFPEGGTVHHVWTSPNGVYQGHVVVIPTERDVELHAGHVMPNPDDPKGDKAEQAAWWDVAHAKKNPALRPEVKSGTPWKQLESAGVSKTASTEPQQFEKMYHSSPKANRSGIAETGLDTDHDAGEGNTQRGIYMSPHPTDNPYEDQWEVNTSGLRVHPDDPYQMDEFRDAGGSYYSPQSIPPERVRLHTPATKHWTEAAAHESTWSANETTAPEYSVRQDEEGPTFEAHVSGKNVGYLTTHDKGDHVFFDGLYVHPDHRGGGLGRQLMQQGMDYHQGRTLALKPDPYHEEGEQEPGASANALKRFYHGMGFQPAGEYMTKQADYAANDAFSGIENHTPVDAPLHNNSQNPASTGYATSDDPLGWNGESPFGGRDDVPMASYSAGLNVRVDARQGYAQPIELGAVRGMWNAGEIPVVFDRSGAVLAELHDEPEGALPYTDGDSAYQEDPANPYTGDTGENQGSISDIEDEGTPNSVTALRLQTGNEAAVADIVASFQATAAANSLMATGGARAANDGMNIAAAAQAHLQKHALKDFNFREQQELINEGVRDGVRARNMGDLQIQGTHYEALNDALGAEDFDDATLFA